MTERDFAILRFVGEMQAVRGDVLRRLLAEYGGREEITPRRLRWHLSRWEQMGLVRREPFRLGLREPCPGAWTWVALTRRGDRLVGLGERDPASLDLHWRKHCYAAAVVRLEMEADGWVWESERLLWKRYARQYRETGITVHRPDGLAFRDGETLAVEVELTLKRQPDYMVVIRNVDPDATGIRYYARSGQVDTLERLLSRAGPLHIGVQVFPLPVGATDAD